MQELLVNREILGFTVAPIQFTSIQGFYLKPSNKSFKMVYARNYTINNIFEGYYELVDENQIKFSFVYELDLAYLQHRTIKFAHDASGSPFSNTFNGLISTNRFSLVSYNIKSEIIEHFDGQFLKISHTTIKFSLNPLSIFELPDTNIDIFYTNFLYNHKEIDIKLYEEKKARLEFFNLIDSNLYKDNIVINDISSEITRDNIDDTTLIQFYNSKPPAFKDLHLLSINKDLMLLGKLHKVDDKILIDRLLMIDFSSITLISCDIKSNTIPQSYQFQNEGDIYRIEKDFLKNLSSFDDLNLFIATMLLF